MTDLLDKHEDCAKPVFVDLDAIAAHPDALIVEARRRPRRRRLGIAAALALIGLAVGLFAAFGSQRHAGVSNKSAPAGHLCVRDTQGWRSLTDARPGIAPTLVLTNFRFGRLDYLYGHTDRRLRWPADGILISIADWTRGATDAMKTNYLNRPLQVGAGDFRSLEGVANLGQRHVTLRGHLLELWVQARPTTPATIRAANVELRGVHICG
jgi:hypothetical protein